MVAHYAQIRFILDLKGNYAEYWCTFLAQDMVEASRLFAAFRCGYYIATNRRAGNSTITSNRPPDGADLFDLTTDSGRDNLMLKLAQLKAHP